MKRASLIVVSLFLASAAKAETIDETLKAASLWGGPFARDCSQPAGPHNGNVTFAGDASRVTLTVDAGAQTAPQIYVIREALRQPDGSLLGLKAEAQSNYAIHEVVYMLGQNPEGFRALSIRVTTSGAVKVVAEKGAFVKSGADTPWYVHCR